MTVPAQERTHIYLPQMDPAGNLALYVDITVDVNETLYTGPLWLDREGLIDVSNPDTFQPGIIDIWAEEPIRADLQVRSPVRTYTLPGVDFHPHPQEQVRVPKTMLVDADEPPDNSRLLQASDEGARWEFFDPLVAHFHHDGTQSGSTVVSQQAAWNDTEAEQTWLGSASGNDVVSAYGSLALGAEANVPGVQTVSVGFWTQRNQNEQADYSTAIGYSCMAGANAVTVGMMVELEHAETTVLGNGLLGLDDGVFGITCVTGDGFDFLFNRVYDHATVVGMPQGVSGTRQIGAGSVFLGQATAPTNPMIWLDQTTQPTVVIGAENASAVLPSWSFGYVDPDVRAPFILHGTRVDAHALQAADDAVLAGSGKTLAFFDEPGRTKGTIVDNGANASVTALLTALHNMGLLTRA